MINVSKFKNVEILITSEDESIEYSVFCRLLGFPIKEVVVGEKVKIYPSEQAVTKSFNWFREAAILTLTSDIMTNHKKVIKDCIHAKGDLKELSNNYYINFQKPL